MLRKEEEIPSGHDPADYVTRRIFAPAPDGETVPVSLLYRKDTPLDGTAPLPALRLRRLRHHDSGGLLDQPAVAGRPRLRLRHRPYPRRQGEGLPLVRRRAAREEDNTFTDFIAAAEHPGRRAAIPSRGQIVGGGGSAGGLLIGAVANMAPELFAGLIAEVPFVDVLNTMLDDTLPLTPPEWPEWGNPIASEADYRTIARLLALRQRRGRSPIRRSWRSPA